MTPRYLNTPDETISIRMNVCIALRRPCHTRAGARPRVHTGARIERQGRATRFEQVDGLRRRAARVAKLFVLDDHQRAPRRLDDATQSRGAGDREAASARVFAEVRPGIGLADDAGV